MWGVSMGLTSDQVARCFVALARCYAPSERIRIELYAPVKGCPARAAVCWDGLGWLILAKTAEPVELLSDLFHELGHTLRGHVDRESVKTLAHYRDVFAGRVRAAGGIMEAVAKRERADWRAREAALDNWAAGQARSWLPTLLDWDGDAQRVAQVAGWVKTNTNQNLWG